MINTIETIYQIKKIEKDEIFKKIETEQERFISNYGRVVTLLQGKYQIEKIYGGTETNRYYYVKCKNKDSLKYNSKLYIHRLVAEAFCKKSNSWHSDYQVHHIVKFNPKLSNEVNNRATNLMWIGEPHIHKMLDSIDYIVIWNTNEVVEAYCAFYNPIEAFRRMEIIKEGFYERVFRKHPNKRQGNLNYYTVDEYLIVIHLYESVPKRLILGNSQVEDENVIDFGCYQITCTEEEAEKPKREGVA